MAGLATVAKVDPALAPRREQAPDAAKIGRRCVRGAGPMTDTDRSRRIARLADEARTLSDADQRAFLQTTCGGDEALRRDVEWMLTTRAPGTASARPQGDQEDAPPVALASRCGSPGGESGTLLGSYRIERVLGRGGMGAVFLAYDTKLHREVAVKMLSGAADGAVSSARLLREARNAAALNHPNICVIHEVGESDAEAFIAMEYVGGRSLRDRIDEGALTLAETLRFGIQAADALAYAHNHGVIHRDLKAANAIVTDDGRLKIVDFGLAHRADPLTANATTEVTLATAGVPIGTPYAMAPEQVRGESADVRTDVWSLGVLLYEMVSGAKPFKGGGSAQQLFTSILRDPPAPLPDGVPADLRAVIERCLNKDRGARFQQAREVCTALERMQESRQARRRRAPALLALAVGAVVVVALVLWVLFAPGPNGGSSEPLRIFATAERLDAQGDRAAALEQYKAFASLGFEGPERQTAEARIRELERIFADEQSAWNAAQSARNQKDYATAEAKYREVMAFSGRLTLAAQSALDAVQRERREAERPPAEPPEPAPIVTAPLAPENGQGATGPKPPPADPQPVTPAKPTGAPASPNRSRTTTPECARLLERLSLGETLTAAEQTYLARNCRG